MRPCWQNWKVNKARLQQLVTCSGATLRPWGALRVGHNPSQHMTLSKLIHSMPSGDQTYFKMAMN